MLTGPWRGRAGEPPACRPGRGQGEQGSRLRVDRTVARYALRRLKRRRVPGREGGSYMAGVVLWGLGLHLATVDVSSTWAHLLLADLRIRGTVVGCAKDGDGRW